MTATSTVFRDTAMITAETIRTVVVPAVVVIKIAPVTEKQQ